MTKGLQPFFGPSSSAGPPTSLNWPTAVYSYTLKMEAVVPKQYGVTANKSLYFQNTLLTGSGTVVSLPKSDTGKLVVVNSGVITYFSPE